MYVCMCVCVYVCMYIYDRRVLQVSVACCTCYNATVCCARSRVALRHRCPSYCMSSVFPHCTPLVCGHPMFSMHEDSPQAPLFKQAWRPVLVRDWLEYVMVHTKEAAKLLKEATSDADFNAGQLLSTGDHLRDRPVPVQCTCTICGAVRRSAQALAVHRSQQHGIVRNVAAVARQTYCTICLQQLWNYERLCNHLEKVARCKTVTLNTQPPMEPDEIIQIREVATK